MARRLVPWLFFLLCVPLASPAQGATKEQQFVGVHQLGVNRVSPKRRAGSVTVTQRDGVLQLTGSARAEPFYLELEGTITRVDARVLELAGELRGVPDMRWADEPLRARKTVGKFTFRVTKGRKFWRLYEIDGTGCVCDDGCGNDFCYIDIDVRVDPLRAK